MAYLTLLGKHGALEKASEPTPTGDKTGYSVLSVSQVQGKDRMAREVLAGLGDKSQKTLPCTYFYDAHGSLLYEQITALPAYYPTRLEAAVLRQVAPALRILTETAQGEPPEMVELGSGSSVKTEIILDEWQRCGQLLTYIPVDVSQSMLTDTAIRLTRQYEHLNVLGLAGQYEDALAFLPAQRERLFLFLGGTIGNFSPVFQDTFFRMLREKMGPGSRLLLGFDRQPHPGKAVQVIEEAYNDPQGVTALFNLNLLTHINEKLDSDFVLPQWCHEAVYNREAHQIEMYLESLCAQTVHFAQANREFAFRQGERVLTEISRKFDPTQLAQWFEARGFRCRQNWTDSAGWFGLMLLES